jgi:DNA invertase Pin-like site-specific DNA recombinase
VARLKKGDTLLVYKLDRSGRSMSHLRILVIAANGVRQTGSVLVYPVLVNLH